MHRRTTWSLIIGLVLLIGALLIVDMMTMEPYLQYKAFINRRTGQEIEYEVYCDHFARRYFPNLHISWVDLSPYGMLTAPDIEVPVSTMVFKHHFWSSRMQYGQPILDNPLGNRLEDVFDTLFTNLRRAQLPRAQALELYRQRIEIWNSDFPDRATREDIEKLQAENARLFPSLPR